MQAHQLKINNSYESEISSNGGSSSLEESTYENRSFEDTIPKLQDIFKPRCYGVEYFNETDSVGNDTEKNSKEKISNNAINSSQESEFLGFPAEREYLPCVVNLGSRKLRVASKAVSSSDESDFLGFSSDTGKKREVEIYFSSQESDFTGFPENSNEKQSTFVLLPSKETAYADCERRMSCLSEVQLPVSSTKPMEDTGVLEMINAENSCNAVDVKLSNERVDVAFVSKLSFDGTIKPLDQTPLCDEKSMNNETNKDTLEIETDTSQVYKYANERSPDLFDDEDDDNATTEPLTKYTQQQFSEATEDTSLINAVSGKERELLKRIQKSLSGIPPPPSVTIMQIDMFNSITKNKENILNYFDNMDMHKRENESIFKPTHSVEEVKLMKWPETLSVRSHGLCYNLSTVTETIETLSMSVLERFIGAETCSSFQRSPSSAKKRAMRMKVLSQSPGSRLSHLARRRAIFSSANLQFNSQKISTSKIVGKQILLDSKKSENRRKKKIITPKRRTPGKRKTVRNTPSSSAKKRLLFRTEQASIAPTRETSKRALFQSPPQQQKINTKPIIKPEIATRVERSKRALFSPEKPGCSFAPADARGRQSFNDENLTKRKREDDEIEENMSKFSRNDSLSNVENLTPRSLKIKSQSFCAGSGTRGSLDTITGKSLFRASSDTTFCSNQLSESHKKKLLWAVSQALQSKQITLKHSNFKQYASTLARVVKRLFLENCQKSGSTSDTLLRLAKKNVFWVIQGKTADEIYLQERTKLQHEKLLAPKLTGYIGPEDYENRKMLVKKCSQSTLFSENSTDSFNLSQALGYNITQSSQNSEFMCQMSQDTPLTRDSRLNSAIKLPIHKSPSLQNSSSKNNLTGSALRENVDCELRRSGQKNFTGKDQKNLSPYSDKVRTSGKKCSSSIHDTNTMKVKRQISFDS